MFHCDPFSSDVVLGQSLGEKTFHVRLGWADLQQQIDSSGMGTVALVDKQLRSLCVPTPAEAMLKPTPAETKPKEWEGGNGGRAHGGGGGRSA